MRIARANAIPETAFVISLALTVLYGALQMALVGFNQLSADGATFIGDHAAVAYYNNPTSSNATYAQQVGTSVFTHANGTYSASNPVSGTYEVDYNASEKTIASFFPSQLTVQSRIIEPSQNSASLNTPLGNCATGRLNDSTSAINSAQGPAVGLMQALTAAGLFKISQDQNAKASINLQSSVIDSQVATLNGIKTQLSTIATYINLLSGPLNLTSGTLGTLLGTVGLSNVNAVVSGDVTNQLDLALSGSLNNSNLQTSTSMQAQITTALGSTLGALASSVAATVMTTINNTFSAAGQPTPFSDTGLFGADGPLMKLSQYEQTLNNIDSLAPSSC